MAAIWVNGVNDNNADDEVVVVIVAADGDDDSGALCELRVAPACQKTITHLHGLRINGTFRWSEQQTRDLLTIFFENVKANPEQFEKPTAQKFYDRIKQNSPKLCTIKGDNMRTKMRHLKTSFLAAVKWKSQTGAGLLENGDVTSVEEYIKKTCPFYNDLHAIFARRINIQPPAIYQSTTTTKRNLKRAESSSPFALLFEIQKKKVVRLETQKLEF
ncbi:uncharacterized protein LOC128855660 [Anastrepha ludens]|uniref:uncharacterized protein LOC128855660 n=1 Tax=Anastrepha ludens TaxID=28586 RepID=UPI0023AFBBDF|nr:uncharacterized protein LOC128855660 [Anastrepha ludens]